MALSVAPTAPNGRPCSAETHAFVPDPYLDLASYEADADLLTLSFGPQHPSTHGVFRAVLYLDGEVIVKAVPHLGYLHRGVEKLCEKLSYSNITPILDKNDYVAPMFNEQAANMAFEQLLHIEVPLRAQFLRTLLGELQRIASHLLWLGTFTMDLGGALGGGTSIFMYCFRERELILDVFEALTGCRFHYNTHCVGGNRHDIPAGWPALVHGALTQIETSMREYVALFEHPVFVARTRGVGVLDAELALELGLSGPLLRASGVDHDLRRDAPYQIYDRLDVRVATDGGGDCFSRYKVRVDEIAESIRLVRILLDNVPAGPISATKPLENVTQFKITSGQVYVAIESPRGELGSFVVAGGKGPSPLRMKIRPPSLHALGAVPYLFPRHTLSDAVAILGSLDPIMGEADR